VSVAYSAKGSFPNENSSHILKYEIFQKNGLT
jgi:hypothetical protein